MILHWRRNVDAEDKMTFKQHRQLLVRFLCSVVNMSLLLRELLFESAHYLFQSLQLILHASINSRCNNVLTRQLFYHLCQSSHLFSEHQLVVSTFVELIEYSQLVQFLMYILRLDWIFRRDSDIHLSLTRWCHIDDAHHLLLMIRMKHEHHVDDVLLSKEIDVNFYYVKISRWLTVWSVYLKVLIYWINVKFQFHEHFIEFTSFDIEHIECQLMIKLMKILKNYIIKNKLFKVVINNASNNSILKEKLEKIINHHEFQWNRTQNFINCLTHIINLIT